MRLNNVPPSKSAHQNNTRMIEMPSAGLFLRVGAILILAGLLVSGVYWNSAASTAKKALINPSVDTARDEVTAPVVSAGLGGVTSLGTGTYYSLFLLPPPPTPITITTYASDCSTPKTVFNLQDADKVVCAKVTGAQSFWRILWSNSNFITLQNVPVGTGTSTFTLTSTSSLGDWRVILYDPFGGSVQKVTSFTVIDAANPRADVSVSKGAISGSTSSGSQVVYSVQVSNSGPSAATAVSLSDSIPTNTSFESFVQFDGPTFTCVNPAHLDTTGSSVCTIASLNRGETATFVATYKVGAAAGGSVISNTATVTTTTSEPVNPFGDNNTSTSEVPVVATACQLSTPENITVDAAGQTGVVVTYATPTGTGDCGQTTTGEGGEVIPPISCSPASGSFFAAGTTTVICSAQTGPAVSFQVTVNNPGGGLSISLNGASTMAAECGTAFGEPGVTASDGAGHILPMCPAQEVGDPTPTNCWSVTYPSGFNPDSPAVGSYTLTYTATSGSNTVSTTRTVNVSDSEAPSITVNGANPYQIQQGSCSPFVDPGASGHDSCAGPKPVSSSISGPGGATSVDNNTPGTYTVTYTATDGAHQATATRKVLVGNFPPEDVDQPPSANVPPTITLTCPTGVDDCSLTTIECGDTFTDLGATASVCGGSVPVTTSGTVDRHTPGVYSITYTATANGLTSTATRTVTVEPDNTAPTITLNGANPTYVECHTGTYTEAGATAHDACAGDFPATASGSVNPDVVASYTITYNATDPSGHAATPVTRTVIVRDTTPPTVTAPANVTVYTGSGATSCSATVSDATIGSASANDACQGSLPTSRSGVPSGNVFPVGTTTITYSAIDASSNTSTATQTVTVVDNTPPTITLNGQTPSMWPPNHKYQTFGVTNFVTGVTDSCDTTLGIGSVVIEKVTSDEIENGNGDGNTLNDIVIAADCKSVQLRSEREGGGNGRVYTIFFKVTDASGNVGTATAKVVVQHNPGETAVDSGVHYTVCCHGGTCP